MNHPLQMGHCALPGHPADAAYAWHGLFKRSETCKTSRTRMLAQEEFKLYLSAFDGRVSVAMLLLDCRATASSAWTYWSRCRFDIRLALALLVPGFARKAYLSLAQVWNG